MGRSIEGVQAAGLEVGRHGSSGRTSAGRRERREGGGVAGVQGVEAVPAPAPAAPASHKGLFFRSLFLDFVLLYFGGDGRVLELSSFGWLVQMITAGCLAGVSDSVAQKLSGYQKIEKRRLFLKMVKMLPSI